MSIISRYHQKNILPPGLASLYTSRTIVLIAMGFTGLFYPIFLLLNFHSLEKTIIWYLVTWALYVFSVALGVKMINYIGIKNSIIASLPFLALFYFASYNFSNNLLFWVVIAALALTFYRMLFWVPFHTDFTKFSQKKIRGRQIGLLGSISSILGIIIPVISGFLIKNYGFDFVFVIVIILIFVAIIPLIFLPKVKEKFSWSYLKTWKEYFAHKNRKMMVAYMADGAENWIGGVLWPIFIWQLLNGEFLTVGLLSSVITFVAVILKLIIGDYTDRFDKRKLVGWGSILYSVGWIVKIFITTAVQIFFASTYHNFAMVILRTPFSALVYEKMADSGHYVDEYSTLREMYLHSGRIIVIVIVLFLLNYLSLNFIFILAAFASLFVNLLPKQGLYEKTGIK
ncbi:MFS transporter [Patescibacteria group bacterium]|nr:MFS transporter [Patescibacteria group bacterium]